MGEFDLTIEKDVVALMELSTTSREWEDNCSKVKDANGGGYPSFWYKAIILSGVGDRVLARWGSSTKMRTKLL